MRKLILIIVALAGACANVDQNPRFAPHQVWQLRDQKFGGAEVVIGLVERRGNRTVVHASIADLPGPNSAGKFFDALERENYTVSMKDKPLHFIISGMSSESIAWSSLSADLGISADRSKSSITIPHIVVYAEELRQDVSVLVRSGPPLHSMFEADVQLWRDSEGRWPEFNREDLNASFAKRIAMVLDSTARMVSDPGVMSRLGPPPPAAAKSDEIAINDASLDARCREIVDPEPLDPKFVANLVKQGIAREDIPEIDVTLSNIVVTSSPEWGHVWRADTLDKHAPAGSPLSRSVCWRKSANEQPAVTDYPLPAAPPHP